MGYMTFNFGHGRGVPYFTIGGGVAEFDPSIVGVSTNSKTYGTAAIGGAATSTSSTPTSGFASTAASTRRR